MNTHLTRLLLPLVCATLAAACNAADAQERGYQYIPDQVAQATSQPSGQGQPLADPPPVGRAVANLAGGCFWCLEGPLEAIPGVDTVVSGYTGGAPAHPTYAQVAGGRTTHVEAVRVTYDPARVSYAQILEVFVRQIDPTDSGGQFADRGPHYRPVIYVADDTERAAAQAALDTLAQSGRFDRPVTVEIAPIADFYVAEDNHQDYYRTNSTHYQAYRRGSGRAGYLQRIWGE